MFELILTFSLTLAAAPLAIEPALAPDATEAELGPEIDPLGVLVGSTGSAPMGVNLELGPEIDPLG